MEEDIVTWDDYLQIASQSDVGMRRNNNQDNLSISLATTWEQWDKYGHLFVVCDGMGGHAAGELASQLAADHLAHLHKRPSDLPYDERLRRYIEQSNGEIHRRGLANPEFRNMGTTCTALLLTKQGAWAGHVGDSRLYRLRGSRMEQLTFDHSYTWEMKAAGISDASAEVFKNRIMRSLGPSPEVRVDIEGPFAIEPGDTFLLCSDGLTGPVEDREIAQMMAALCPPEVSEALVNLANLRGGPDNITAIVVKCQRRIHDEPFSTHAKTPRLNGGLLGAWSAFGIFIIVAVVLGLLADWTTAVIPGVAGLISLVVAIWLTVKQAGTAEPGAGPPRGKAPYTHCSGVASIEVVNRLRGVVEELVSVAKREAWAVDSNELDARMQRLQQSTENSQLPEAVAGYCELMNRVLKLGRSR
jgi:protein phosphatase